MILVRQKGYTLLEVLIVISVSAAMFSIVAITFGGKQDQVQFTQAVRDFDSQLKDIMNDVSVGYFETDKTVECRAIGGGSSRRPQVTINATADNSLGSNDDCVLVGKVMQFSPSKADSDTSGLSSDSDQIIRIFNMVGLREDAAGNNPVTLEESKPRAIPLPSILQLRYGLRVTDVIMENQTPPTKLGAISFFSSYGRTVGNETSDTGENLKVSAIRGTVPTMTQSNIITSVLNDLENPSNQRLYTSSKIILCVSNPSKSRRASITFGGNSQGTVLDFDSYNTALCNS